MAHDDARFPDASESELRSIMQAIARDPGEDRRQRNAREAWEMYKGEQLQFIVRNPEETPEEFLDRPKMTLNITDLFVRVLSGLYTDPPVRTITVDGQPEAEKKLQERFQKMWEAVDINSAFLEYDRVARATGVAAVRLHYDPDHYGPGEGEVIPYMYPSHIMDGLSDASLPWKPLGLVLKFANFNGLDAEGSPSLMQTGEIWTRRSFGLIRPAIQRKDAEIVWFPNLTTPGQIPIVLMKNANVHVLPGRPDTTNLFPDGPGWDLAENNMTLNTRLSDDLWTIKLQGFGIPVLKNPMPDQKLTISPSRALAVYSDKEKEGGLEFAAPNAPLDKLIEHIEMILRQFMVRFRIPESAISVNLKSNVSGISITASRTPILEDRTQRIRMFETYERELFNRQLDVLETHEPEFSIPDRKKIHLDIDFQGQSIESIDALIKKREFELEHNITTPVEIVMTDNPGKFGTPEEAEKFIRKNTELNKDVAGGIAIEMKPFSEEEDETPSGVLPQPQEAG